MERYFIIHLGACDIDNRARRSYYNLLFPKIRLKSVILGARIIETEATVRDFNNFLYLRSRRKVTIKLKFETIIICKSFVEIWFLRS